MTGVAVGHADNAVFLLGQLDQLVRLLGGEAQRLLADNVQTGFESSLADLVVHTVRRCDGNGLYTVRALGLLSEHGLVVRIAAVRVNMQLLAEVLAALGIDVERTGNQFKVEVAQCRRAMDVANLAAAAAAGPFGAEVVPVARQDYNKPLAVLAGLDDDPGTVLPFNGGPLGGRMVVLCGLEDQVDCLLPALRQAGIGRDCLKAVLTPHNRTWTAVKLYQELLREHQAMNGR